MYMYMQSSSGWVSEWAGSTCTCNMQSSSGWVSEWAGSTYTCTCSLLAGRLVSGWQYIHVHVHAVF